MKLRLATADDEEQLFSLASRTAMPGRLRLARPAIVRPWTQTVVAEERGRLVACGQRVRRWRYVNGELHPTAYLAGLRVAPEARHNSRILLRGYGLMHELHEEDGRPPTFTSIMGNNDVALALFAEPRRGLPHYEFIGPYLTAVARGGAFRRLPPAQRCERPPQFAAPVTPEITRSDPPFRLVGFGGRLGILNLVFPTGGIPIETWCLWQQARENNCLRHLPRRKRYLTGAHPSDPFIQLLSRRPGVQLLHSRLYAIRWPGDGWQLDSRPVSPEVGDL